MSSGADLLDLVDPLCGSDSEPGFSTGLTYPAVAVPGGMTFFSPRNRPGGQVFSRRPSWPVNRIEGFTATHSPSTWIGDYGTFTLMPGVAPAPGGVPPRDASYALDTEVSRPDYYRVRLNNGGIECELTATRRCGVLRLTYPHTGPATLTLRLHAAGDEADADVPRGLVTGVARNGPGVPGDFGCRFVVELDRPCREARRIPAASVPGGGIAGRAGAAGDLLVLAFDAVAGRPVTVRVGTSFISADQARLNLDREVGRRGFDGVRAETAGEWARELSRVLVDGGPAERLAERRRTFYTCLWRSLLFPRDLHEVDAGGRVVHFSPYTGRVEAGPLVSDNGFWDTSRTVYPLLSLAYRERLGGVLDGWTTAYTQSGWMPQWAGPGHRSCMVGTHSAAVFADAISKGVGGFDAEVAYASMVKDATLPGDEGGRWGRQQLREYLDLGYCPEVGGLDSVCRTLDYGYNDWCCARVADALGRPGEARDFDRRAGNWRHLFDPQTRFFRPRDAGGAWSGPFEEFRWGGPYREGGPWQYRFAVPHDPRGLAEVMGGPDALAAEVSRMVATPPRFEVGTYGDEIHEMAEMAAATMGQYSHSNQPVHGVLWSAARVGRADVTDALVRRVLDELYAPGVFPGDEDNGEMSAWYVLAALGLFPHCPGDPSYTTTAPLFDEATLAGDDGPTLRLRRGDAGTQTPDRRVAHADLIAAARAGDAVVLP